MTVEFVETWDSAIAKLALVPALSPGGPHYTKLGEVRDEFSRLRSRGELRFGIFHQTLDYFNFAGVVGLWVVDLELLDSGFLSGLALISSIDGARVVRDSSPEAEAPLHLSIEAHGQIAFEWKPRTSDEVDPLQQFRQRLMAVIEEGRSHVNEQQGE